MAILVSINEVELCDCTFEDVVQHFKREYFTTMLTQGTPACRGVVKTMYCTIGEWAVEQGNMDERPVVTEKIVNDTIVNLTDAILTGGFDNLYHATFGNMSWFIKDKDE